MTTVEQRIAFLEAQVFELQHRMDWSDELTTQQGLRHASFRAIGGTASTYEGDARAAFEVEATIPAGSTFNEAFILWLQARLGSADTNLQNLMQAFAEQQGAHSWSALGSFDPASGGYTANPLEFDGANDYLTRGADLDGNADSKLWTGSLWIRRNGNEGVLQAVYGRETGTRVRVRWTTGNLFQIIGQTSAAVNTLNITTSAITGTDWHHIMWSVDLANASNRHLYVDGVSDMHVSTYNDNKIDFTVVNYGVGADPDAGASKFVGDLADVQMWHGAYIDLSVEANRELFILAGAPVDPATAAASALGDPIVLLSGATDTWHINKGTGGGFTENGALTDGTGPVEL